MTMMRCEIIPVYFIKDGEKNNWNLSVKESSVNVSTLNISHFLLTASLAIYETNNNGYI